MWLGQGLAGAIMLASSTAAMGVNDVTPALWRYGAAVTPRPTRRSDLVSDDFPVFIGNGYHAFARNGSRDSSAFGTGGFQGERIVLPNSPQWNYGRDYMIPLKKLEEAVSIRRQIDTLEERFASLIGTAPSGLTNRAGRREVSAATGAKLSAAARARWANKKGGHSVTAATSLRKTGGITPAGRRRLSQLMRARWAARRKVTTSA